MSLSKDQIKAIALDNGFKLKEQPDGSFDLNPYVYDFAKALRKAAPNLKTDVEIKFINPVPSVKILYDVNVIKAASRLRNAFGSITGNDREKLLIIMGDKLKVDADITVCLFETTSEVRVEDVRHQLSPTTIKVFTPDSLPSDTAKVIAKYILSVLTQPMMER